MTTPRSIHIVRYSVASGARPGRPFAAHEPIGGVLGSISIHVAAYDSLLDALDDWDIAHLASALHHDFLDAVLVETERATICALHRFSSDGVARGSIAASMVGLLRPPALVCGAIAGGVGEQTITSLSAGLDRDGIRRLGVVMDTERFTIVVVSATPSTRPHVTSAMHSFGKARTALVVTTELTSESVVRAALSDDQRAR